MVILNFLRALVDLGIYYSTAGMAAAVFGSQLALNALLLQSACFALSFSLRRSKAARLAALLPGLLPPALVLAVPIHPADVLVCLPPVLYLMYLAWTDSYQLSWSRQADMFTVFWRAFLVMAIIMVLMSSWRAVLTPGMPAALITAAASVLLTRSLRHEPSVYLQSGYQLINFVGIVLLAAAALVLGSEQVLQAATLLLRTFYSYIILPIMVGAAMLIAACFMWIPAMSRWINPQSNVIDIASEDGFQEQMDKIEEMLPTFDIAVYVKLIMTIAVVAALILIFRWMARQRASGHDAVELLRNNIPGRQQPELARPGTYAYRIRRQYRAFLRLCRSKGLEFPVSDTSTDVGRKSLRAFPDEAAMEGLRDLYQQARYQGEATREDYQQFKMLLGVLKKAQTAEKKAKNAG